MTLRKPAAGPPKRGATRVALPHAPGRKIKNKHPHCLAPDIPAATSDDAEHARVQAQDGRVTALRAKAWLTGWVLHAAPSGGFLACRWGRVHELPTLADAEAFLKRVGVRIG